MISPMEVKDILTELAAAPNGAKFLYLTPGQSLHSEAEDPRESAT